MFPYVPPPRNRAALLQPRALGSQGSNSTGQRVLVQRITAVQGVLKYVAVNCSCLLYDLVARNQFSLVLPPKHVDREATGQTSVPERSIVTFRLHQATCTKADINRS
jgi:hypothetical protein